MPVAGQPSLDEKKRRLRAHGLLDTLLSQHVGKVLILPLSPHWEDKHVKDINQALVEVFASPQVHDVLLLADANVSYATFAAFARAMGRNPADALDEAMDLYVAAHGEEIRALAEPVEAALAAEKVN